MSVPSVLRSCGEGAMRSGAWRLSPLAWAVALVIIAAASLGFVLAKRSVDSQNQALLKDDATQAAGYVSSLISSLGSTLDALAPGVSSTKGSPLAFAAQAQPLASGPFTLVLARKVGSQFVATAVAGTAFRTGEVLDQPLAIALGRAGSSLSSGPVAYSGKTSTFGVALGPPLVSCGLCPLRTDLPRPLRRDHCDTSVTVPRSQGRRLRFAQAGNEPARPGQRPLAAHHGCDVGGPRAVRQHQLVAGRSQRGARPRVVFPAWHRTS